MKGNFYGDAPSFLFGAESESVDLDVGVASHLSYMLSPIFAGYAVDLTRLFTGPKLRRESARSGDDF